MELTIIILIFIFIIFYIYNFGILSLLLLFILTWFIKDFYIIYGSMNRKIINKINPIEADSAGGF